MSAFGSTTTDALRKHPLHAFRMANRITLDAFAKLLDVSVATVSRIENGKQAITAEMAVAIERVTEGAVSRGSMRPDLWAEPPPEDAPAEPAREVAAE